MYYNLICIFICTSICTKKNYSCKKWVLHRGGEEGVPATRPDDGDGPSVATTLTDVAVAAPPAVDNLTSGTASRARDLSPGTTSSIAIVAMSTGTARSGVTSRLACTATLGKSWVLRPSAATWVPSTLAAPPALGPRAARVPLEARALNHKSPYQHCSSRRGKKNKLQNRTMYHCFQGPQNRF
jgi:hypothetical protein